MSPNITAVADYVEGKEQDCTRHQLHNVAPPFIGSIETVRKEDTSHSSSLGFAYQG